MCATSYLCTRDKQNRQKYIVFQSGKIFNVVKYIHFSYRNLTKQMERTAIYSQVKVQILYWYCILMIASVRNIFKSFFVHLSSNYILLYYNILLYPLFSLLQSGKLNIYLLSIFLLWEFVEQLFPPPKCNFICQWNKTHLNLNLLILIMHALPFLQAIYKIMISIIIIRRTMG